MYVCVLLDRAVGRQSMEVDRSRWPPRAQTGRHQYYPVIRAYVLLLLLLLSWACFTADLLYRSSYSTGKRCSSCIPTTALNWATRTSSCPRGSSKLSMKHTMSSWRRKVCDVMWCIFREIALNTVTYCTETIQVQTVTFYQCLRNVNVTGTQSTIDR